MLDSFPSELPSWPPASYFYTSRIEVYFTYCQIHPLQMCDPVTVSKRAALCDRRHPADLERFHQPQEVSLMPV